MAHAGQLTFDAAGNLFAVHRHSVSKFTANGTKTIVATGFQSPIGLCVDSQGNVFVSDFASNSIFKIASDGKRSTFANGLSGEGMAFDRSNNLLVAHGDSVFKITPSGVKGTFASGVSNLSSPIDLALDGSGNLFLVPIRELDGKPGISPSIIKFSPDRVRSLFASSLNEPRGISLDEAGNLFVTVETDEQGTGYLRRAILKFSPDGTNHIFASGLAIRSFGLAVG